MSQTQPIFGVDIASHQAGLSLAQVRRDGYEFCVVKATEGPTHDGWIYTNPEYAKQISGAKAAGLVTGVYHFLVEGPAKAQVDHFLSTVGGAEALSSEARIVMVDFEEYGNRAFPQYDPTNATLKAFISELQRRIGDHPVVLYSGQGYWNGGIPSGPVSQYGRDLTTWDASYPLHPEAGFGSVLYERVKSFGWGKRWGGVEPKVWQFSANGRVAGFELDVNAFSGTREELLALTGAETVGSIPTEEVPGIEPVLRPLAPADFFPLQPQAGDYVARHPTRYTWRGDIEALVRRIYDRFPGVHINTYFDHPEGFGRDLTSFDVWDGAGRGNAIDPALGQQVFNFVFDDPNPPMIDWCIWQRRMWTRAGGWEPFGTNTFTFHDDHPHFTMQ